MLCWFTGVFGILLFFACSEPRDMHRLAAEGLLHMAERLADPFRNATHNTLWKVSQEHGRKLLACWKLYDDVDGKYVCATSVFEVRRLCKSLFVEAIDKNNTEFVCMCPRVYHLLACGLFQFYIPGVLNDWRIVSCHYTFPSLLPA